MKKIFNFSNLKEKFSAFYKNNKKMFFAVVVCFFMIICLTVSSFSSLVKNKKDTKNTSNGTDISITSYAEAVEEKLVNIISKLESITTIDVFVMVDASPTTTYLTEKKETTVTNSSGSTSEISTTVVFEKNGSISTPIVVTTIMPKITGVLIVTNKINSSTKLSIINSISVVLNIDESCISLLQER